MVDAAAARIRGLRRRTGGEQQEGEQQKFTGMRPMELLDTTLSQDAGNWGSLSRTPLAAVQYQPFQPPGERAPE